MSSAVADVQLVAPAKSPKKRAKSQKKNKTRPTVSALILQAAAASTERGGVSLAVLKNALKAGGYDVVKNKARIIAAIKRLVASKYLVQTKGTGASGSFKLNKKPPTPKKKKKVVKKRKPKAKKAKKASPKKAAAKKSPKKKKTAKSPKKAKRPAAPKKARSPKKVKRNVTKSTRTRASAKK